MGAVIGLRLPRRPGRFAVAAAAVGLAVALLGSVGPTSAASTDAAFGIPRATSTFGTSVTFEQPVQLGRRPDRVEILISSPGALGPTVTEVSAPSAGARTLHFALSLAAGHLFPNTTLTASWRLTFRSSVVDGPSVSVVYADTRFAWRTQSGPLVRVHWYDGDAAFGARALAIAERGVATAEQLLGVTETTPIDFFVYAAQAPFYDALGPGTRENVGGEAVTDIRTLFALITPDEVGAAWVGTVISHELTHLVFNTAVANPYHLPPRWLNEGLAVYLSQGYDATDRALVASAAAARTLIPLDGLTGQFPSTAERFYLAYAESVSAVDHMIRTYGRQALVSLVRSYATGITDDEAFQTALGVDTATFDRDWLASLGSPVPPKVGPVPAPPGPVPPGWTSSLPPGAASPPAGGSPSASVVPAASGGAGAGRGAIAIIAAGAVVIGAAILGGLLVRVRRDRPTGGSR